MEWNKVKCSYCTAINVGVLFEFANWAELKKMNMPNFIAAKMRIQAVKINSSNYFYLSLIQVAVSILKPFQGYLAEKKIRTEKK